MWETISTIVIKYWVEFLLGLIVMGGSFLTKRFIKLERAERTSSGRMPLMQTRSVRKAES